MGNAWADVCAYCKGYPDQKACTCGTENAPNGERWTVFAFDGAEPPDTDLRRDVPRYDLLVEVARAAARYPVVLIQRTES